MNVTDKKTYNLPLTSEVMEYVSKKAKGLNVIEYRIFLSGLVYKMVHDEPVDLDSVREFYTTDLPRIAWAYMQTEGLDDSI